MAETLLAPQFTFSPEGELLLRSGNEHLDPDDLIDPIRDEAYERLGALPGVRLGADEGRLTAHIDLERCIGGNFNNQGDEGVERFLILTRRFLPSYLQDDTDRVLSLNVINDRGLVVSVNEHFQRWLNQQGFTEEVAKETVASMALPFGDDYIEGTRKDFRYHALEGVGELATARGVRVNIRNNEFGLTRETSERYEEATVNWRDADLSTLGDCACLGADAREREHVYTHEGVKQLYEMGPHNVDFARQSLSLFLGLGTMAYHAARYDGTEDIFTGVVWKG